MSYSAPVGTSYYISQTFASAKTISAITNANPAVATSTTHGYSDADEVLFNSGWELANSSVFKVDQLTTDTFSFLGLNTTSTTNYAAGTGTGTAQKISTWIQIPQVLTINPSGGTPRYIDVNPISALQGIKIPNGFDGAAIGFEIGFDPSLTNWATLLDISRGGTLVAYKQTKGTTSTYAYGYFAMGEAPLQASGQVDRVNATFVSLGRVISYAT